MRLLSSLLVVVALLLAPLFLGVARPSFAQSQDACPEPNDEFQFACYIGPATDALGVLSSPQDVDAYRFEVLDFGATARVELMDLPAEYRISLFDWNAQPINSATAVGGVAVIEAGLPMPGSYYVFVDSATGDVDAGRAYRLRLGLTYPTGESRRAWFNTDFRSAESGWLADRERSTVSVAEGRLTIALKDGGAPDRAVVDGRWMGVVPSEFIFVIDSRVVAGDRPGIDVRFGVTESAGFGLLVNARQGVVALVRRSAGETTQLSPWKQAAVNTTGGVNRIVVAVSGGSIRALVNGDEAVNVQVDTVPSGRIGFGAVSWGEPTSIRFDNTLVSLPPPGPGDELLVDRFDDPRRGRVQRQAANEGSYEFRYEDGEYRIRRVDPSYLRAPWAAVAGNYDDASIEVDARLVGEPVGQRIHLYCRQAPFGDDSRYYRLSVAPGSGRYQLSRDDGATSVPLTSFQSSAAIRRGNDTNHIELSCSGTTISASVNGVQVASVDDAMYPTGRFRIGAGGTPENGGDFDVRFDNLVVRKQ